VPKEEIEALNGGFEYISKSKSSGSMDEGGLAKVMGDKVRIILSTFLRKKQIKW